MGWYQIFVEFGENQKYKIFVNSRILWKYLLRYVCILKDVWIGIHHTFFEIIIIIEFEMMKYVYHVYIHIKYVYKHIFIITSSVFTSKECYFNLKIWHFWLPVASSCIDMIH